MRYKQDLASKILRVHNITQGVLVKLQLKFHRVLEELECPQQSTHSLSGDVSVTERDNRTHQMYTRMNIYLLLFIFGSCGVVEIG